VCAPPKRLLSSGRINGGEMNHIPAIILAIAMIGGGIAWPSGDDARGHGQDRAARPKIA